MHGLLRENSTSQKAELSNSTDRQKQQQQQHPNPSPPSLIKDPIVERPQTQVGSSIAALWLKVSQDNHPPASIPSTLMVLENCPQCSHRLAPPLNASGYQACGKCGWSSQGHPDQNLLDEPIEPDLLQLLDQATSESLENMKPRKKRS